MTGGGAGGDPMSDPTTRGTRTLDTTVLDTTVAGILRDAAVAAADVTALVHGAPDPDVIRALQDKFGLRRSASAIALCRAGGYRMVSQVRPLLKDSDPTVRQRVATALTEFRDSEGNIMAFMSEVQR